MIQWVEGDIYIPCPRPKLLLRLWPIVQELNLACERTRSASRIRRLRSIEGCATHGIRGQRCRVSRIFLVFWDETRPIYRLVSPHNHLVLSKVRLCEFLQTASGKAREKRLALFAASGSCSRRLANRAPHGFKTYTHLLSERISRPISSLYP
jgi:hypothetical protein